MPLSRRSLFLGLGAVGVFCTGGAALWAWLGGRSDPMVRAHTEVARLLPLGMVFDTDAMSESPEGMVLEGLRFSGGGTEGRIAHAVLREDALRLEGVEMWGGNGILAARMLSLLGIDWERGLVRSGEAEEVAIADAGRLGGVAAARVRLLGWSTWVPTRVELDHARLAIRGGPAAGLDVSAASAVLSLDPTVAGEGSLGARWIRALSAASLQEVSGTVAGQSASAETLEVRLVARDTAGDAAGIELRATALDLGGDVMRWREALLYPRMNAEASLRAIRSQDGSWQADAAFSWPLAGSGEATLEASGASSIWPDLSTLRWRRLSVSWRDAGLVRRLVEQSRAGRSTAEAAAAMAARFYDSALLEGAVSARLDLERWFEGPGVMRLEMTGEGPMRDLSQILDLERPPGASTRLSLR